VSCRFRGLRLRDKKFANPRSPWYSDHGTAREMLGNAAPLLDREGKVRGGIGVLSTSPNTSGRSKRCRSRRTHWLAWRRS
jgi:hypothetical protein